MSVLDSDPVRDHVDRMIREALAHPDNLRDFLEYAVTWRPASMYPAPGFWTASSHWTTGAAASLTCRSRSPIAC